MKINANKPQRKNSNKIKPLRGLPEKIGLLTGYTREGCRKSLIRMMEEQKPTTVMDVAVWQALKKYSAELNVEIEELFKKR